MGIFYGGLSGKNKEDFERGHAKYITYKNVFSNIFASIEKLENVDVLESEHQNKVKYGDVLFTQSSETFEEIGLSSVWLHNYQPYLNSFCLGWSPTQNVVTPQFIGYLLRTPTVRKQIIRQGQGISRINLAASRISDVNLFYPSLQEQERISNLLLLLDRKIDAQSKTVNLLKKYKRGLLTTLLSDNLSWQKVTMKDVATGFDYGMGSAAIEFDGTHKYIRITDIDDDTRTYIQENLVSPNDTPEAKYRVNENDILFARTGASVGKSYLYKKDDGELYFAGFLIRASVKSNFNSYFVYLNTLTANYDKWVKLESMRSGQPGINAEQYKNYSFYCPPIDIQNKIANITQKIESKIFHEQEIYAKLLLVKQSMLQQLFI